VLICQLDKQNLAFDMPKNKRNRRRKGNRRQFNSIPRSIGMSTTTVTLSEAISIVGSSAGSTVNWSTFAGFDVLADFFHYFHPLRFKLEFP